MDQDKYLALTRRLRPRKWGDIYGQPALSRILSQQIISGTLPHAVLLSGERGLGKTTSARLMAASLNCKNRPSDSADPCGKCPSCQSIFSGHSLLVKEIDGGTSGKVEDARELVSEAHYGTGDNYRVWIVDECQMLTAQAWAALLKSIEEPNNRTKWVLCTTDPNKISDAIKSRCQHIQLRLLSTKTLADYLALVVTKLAEHGDVLAATGGLTYEDAALTSIADYAGGAIRDGLAILESIIAYGPVTMDSVVAVMGKVTPVYLDEFVTAVVKGDLKKADTILHELYNDKFMDGFLKYLFGSYFPRGRAVTDAQRRVVTAMLKAATTFVPTYSYSVNRDLLLYSIVESIDAVKHSPPARTAPVPAPTPITPPATTNSPTAAPKPATPQTTAPQGRDDSVLQLIKRFEAQVIRPWDGELAVMAVGTKSVLVAIAGSLASVPVKVGYVIPLGRIPVILKRPTLVVKDMISENLIIRLNRS